MGKNTHALMTGLFMIALVAASTSVIYWMGTLNEQRNVYVIATQESVSGLNPESTVFYRGIAVGKVTNVLFDPTDSGIILVPIEVDNNIIFTQGVYATLRLKGVTGLTQIQLEDDGNIKAVLPPGNNRLFRIPLVPSLTDKLLNSGEELLKKADHLMIRLSSLLNDENEKNIGSILGNLNTLSNKLADLQKGVDNALRGIPALSQDARVTLAHVNALTVELQALSKEVKALSIKTGHLADTGTTAGVQLIQTTLPKVNKLITELQSTTQLVKRVANTLENNPQELLLGPNHEDSGPGEPGYEVPK
ncbi:MAG: MCE family protein [Methylococcaceae bacterium]|nr:MCE family protein [Methylococcaceae bacterium]